MIPKINKAHRDREIVTSALNAIERGYMALRTTEQDLVQVLNRTRRFPKDTIDEFSMEDWETLVEGLGATTNGPEAHKAMNAVRDTCFLEVGKVVATMKRAYGRCGEKRDEEYKLIREPAWPKEERNIRKIIVLENNETEEKIDEQEESMKAWVLSLAHEWNELRERSVTEMARLRKKTGVDRLEAAQVEVWRQKPFKEREEILFNLASATMDPTRPGELEKGAYKDDWRNIRRWLVVLLVEQIGEQLAALNREYSMLLTNAMKRYPKLKNEQDE
jgi:hypothetical protein